MGKGSVVVESGNPFAPPAADDEDDDRERAEDYDDDGDELEPNEVWYAVPVERSILFSVIGGWPYQLYWM